LDIGSFPGYAAASRKQEMAYRIAFGPNKVGEFNKRAAKGTGREASSFRVLHQIK